jgi:RNA polymerase sigma-70 factor (ECF subfamily)
MTERELEALYDAHAEALFRFLLMLTGSDADARDLVQEVFVRIARNPKSLARAAHVRAFLLRSARNAAYDLFRRRGTRQDREGEWQEAAGLFTPEQDLSGEQVEAIEKALLELPPEQRAVVYLKVWCGLTFEAVAELLEISPNTAASRYRYAADKLRDRLRPYERERHA